jgi:hypothetical protein
MTPDPKAAYAAAKVPLGLIPPTFKAALSLALAFGARKYGKASWLDPANRPVRASTYIDAMHRHLDAWASGEDTAEDSGVDHLAHLAASCAILVDARAAGRFEDDRTKVDLGIETLHAQAIMSLWDRGAGA